MFTHTKAFSLLEMLIVLSIFSVLCTLALPKLTGLVQQCEEKTFVVQLQHLIHQAADDALIRHTPIALQWRNFAGNQQMLLFANGKQDGILYNEQDLIQQINVPRHGILYARFYPRYRNFILFFPHADARNDNGSFWFCRKNQTKPAFIITVNTYAESRVLYS